MLSTLSLALHFFGSAPAFSFGYAILYFSQAKGGGAMSISSAVLLFELHACQHIFMIECLACVHAYFV